MVTELIPALRCKGVKSRLEQIDNPALRESNKIGLNRFC